MTDNALPPGDAAADALAHARAQGLPAADPMRWRRIQALAERLAAHQGATRCLLQARLQTLLDEAAAAPVPANPGAPADRAKPGPLGALLAQWPGAAADEPAPAGAPRDLRDLRVVAQHRAAWAQLRAEQRMAQAHTALPEQAGPLNSQLLLHRALTLMRQTAPGYLRHFMAQAEALMWLERSQAAPATPARAAPPREKRVEGVKGAKGAKAPPRTSAATRKPGKPRRG